jgi:hypothetical protein
MIFKYLPFIAIAIFSILGCFQRPVGSTKSETGKLVLDSASERYVERLQELEKASFGLNYDSLGEMIAVIKFDLKTSNLKDYEDGKIPWVRIDSPQLELDSLIGKDEVVLDATAVTVVLDYPLAFPHYFTITADKGFTRAQLLKAISDEYYKIYREEESTATTKTVPLDQRKVYNRNETNGKYGIWGHDITDLGLDDIYVLKGVNGEIYLILEMVS